MVFRGILFFAFENLTEHLLDLYLKFLYRKDLNNRLFLSGHRDYFHYPNMSSIQMLSDYITDKYVKCSGHLNTRRTK